MKVGYVLNSPKALGGASKAFKSMLNGLRQRGVSPIIILPGRGQMYDELCSMGITCFITNFRPNIYPKWLSLKEKALFLPRLMVWRFLNYRARRALLKRLQHEGVALIHTNVGVVDLGFWVSRRLGVPHLYHIREYADRDFGMHYYPRKACFRKQLKADNSFSICITRDIQRHHGQTDSPRSRVIYDGIRPTMTTRPAMAWGDYFLFAGRIETTKGLDILLDAYAICQQKGWEVLPLKVAGRISEADYSERIHQFVTKQQLDHQVTFLGERSDINTLFSEARALVVPSRYEGFGLCMPEAMFSCSLVLAHDTAGTHEQLENGLRMTNTDIALRFTTAEQLALLLAEVTRSSAEKYANMVNNAFNVVNQLYTSEAHVSQVYDYYQDILSTR